MNTFSFGLHQFEGGDGGAAAPAAGTMGDSQSAAPVNTQRGKSGENVLYGKQAVTDTQDAPSDAGKAETDVKVTSNTLEEKRKAYRSMVSGDYKDVYTEDTQRIITAWRTRKTFSKPLTATMRTGRKPPTKRA